MFRVKHRQMLIGDYLDTAGANGSSKTGHLRRIQVMCRRQALKPEVE